MVFLAKGAKTYKLRVDHPDGRHRVLTTGCRVREDAADVELLVRRWQGQKGKRHERLDVIDALLAGRITLAAAAEASAAGTLDALVAVPEPVAASIEVDLLPLIDRWFVAKAKSKKGGSQADTYKKQLLVLYPERPLSLSAFTRKEVWRRIDQLEVDAPTKNRYRTAASSFAKFLVADEVIEHNFVREIEGFGENDPREVYYEIDDAQRLIAGLPQPNAGLAAAALGFCMEWTALESNLVGDLALDADPVLMHVRGTKTDDRDRYVPLVTELAWTLKYIRPLLKGKTPAARIFAGVTNWDALDVQRAVADVLEIVAVGEAEFGRHSLHDWRQTHAVALLRWGYSEQIVADHLGHGNTTLVRENYGKFRPTKYDYAKAGITTPITSANKRRRGGKRKGA